MGLRTETRILQKPGIYCITNTINGKMYIGSSINCKRRLIEHYSELTRNCHHSIRLQNAYNKYGNNNFLFKVLEYITKTHLKALEQAYMDNTKVYDRDIGYNMSTSSESGIYTITDEIRNKISENTKKALKNLSEESRQRMLNGCRKAGKSNLGRKRTKEFSSKRSEYLKKHPVKIRKVITNQGVVFNSVKDAANYYKVSSATIRNSCKGKKLSKLPEISFSYVE